MNSIAEEIGEEIGTGLRGFWNKSGFIYMYINGLDLLLRIEIWGAGCDVEDVELIYLWGS